MASEELPSWRDGKALQDITNFLEAAADIAPQDRLAVFDNDGTLWCEKPRYTQQDFLTWQLRRAVAADPEVGKRTEYQAILAGDRAAMAEMGLEAIALALVALFEGMEPGAFEDCVEAFFDETRHPESGRRYDEMIYLPMLELMAALEARGFTNCLVTGGGTEFVRAVSKRVYGVEQERVVGTLVAYDVARRDGRPVLVRTDRPYGGANEGDEKISNLQMALGRRPRVAGGNSPGDASMLEYTSSLDGPSLTLLVNHDDSEREYAYESVAGTFEAEESIVDTASRLGWTQISMRDDWSTIFADQPSD